MNDYLPWQLMQPAATTALIMEFMRWLTVWLFGVSVLVLGGCLVCLTLQYWSQARERWRSVPFRGVAELQPATPVSRLEAQPPTRQRTAFPTEPHGEINL